jgi:molybdopterin adenylyltransferase
MSASDDTVSAWNSAHHIRNRRFSGQLLTLNDMPQSSSQHQQHAQDMAHEQPVRCAVLTISDTRTMDNDAGGALIVKLVQGAGHVLAARAIVRDEPSQIEAQIRPWLADDSIHAILTTGGTGIAKRDSTIEVVRRMLTAELEGFGELFRVLSYQEIGAAAMLSRAVAGLVITPANALGTLIFCMPGSPNAVEVAMSKLIAPQLAHLVWERRR